MKPKVRPIFLAIAVACGLAPRVAAAAQSEVPVPGRFEETSPGATWTGSWSKNTLPANSGGSAMLTMDAGAEATFVFTGASVSWIGYRDEWCGLAEVFLDGALQTTVDTYATPARAQATLYSVNGLREGRHTLTIRAKGTHGSNSAGSWVWIDAFAIPEASPTSPSRFDGRRPRTPPPSDPSTVSRYDGAARGPRGGFASRFEQEDSAVSWSGPWSTNTLALHRGRSARLSMDPAAGADFAFSGTGVSWVGYQDEWSGIAEVLLDGQLRATVDTYAKPARAQVELYAVDGLQEGPHILTIRPTGRHRRASGGAWIWVDGFSVAR